MSSIRDCPYQIREMCYHLADSVQQKYPNSTLKAVGAFFFLRFFCPALIDPQNFGIVEEPPSPEARRQLLLITKILQNIANGVRFGKKEPFMEPMNDFIDKQSSATTQLFNTLARDPDGSRVCKMLVLPLDIQIAHLDTVIVTCAEHMPAIKERLPSEVAAALEAITQTFVPLIHLKEQTNKKLEVVTKSTPRDKFLRLFVPGFKGKEKEKEHKEKEKEHKEHK